MDEKEEEKDEAVEEQGRNEEGEGQRSGKEKRNMKEVMYSEVGMGERQEKGGERE